jgi:hypothetical protein
VSSLQGLVDAADEAALLRAVDGLCAARDWDALLDLARRCRAAVQIGKQLWPVATHVDYRLALEAPAPFAGGVLRPGAGRFALGPLTEVAGARHPWADIAPHIPDPAAAGAVAQERVIRGEDLRGRCGVAVPTELPLVLAAFEPDYAVPAYRDREARFPAPAAATRRLPPPVSLVPGRRRADDVAARALSDVVATWASESSGQVTAVACGGGPTEAVGLLAPLAGVGELSAGEALGILQWAGASGAARGRRRGGAAGRFAAWWAVAALAGLPWPQEPGTDEDFVDELADALAELRWYRWSRPDAERGWVLRLAVHDPVDGLSWAIEATDELEEDPTASAPSTPEAASGGTR